MNEARLPQGTIRYRELGTGEPVLLVHGLLTNGELWRDVVPRLAQDFRVIAPDWPLGSHELPLAPGSDLSPPGLARIIADFMTALELEHVTLVGNDTGGGICQLVAVNHPERLAQDFRVIAPDWPLGSHELPLAPGSDLSPPGLARIIADFMTALELLPRRAPGDDRGQLHVRRDRSAGTYRRADRRVRARAGERSGGHLTAAALPRRAGGSALSERSACLPCPRRGVRARCSRTCTYRASASASACEIPP